MSLYLIGKVNRLKQLKADRQRTAARVFPNTSPQQLLPHLPEWFQPYFQPSRYKAVWSGRAGGKSHAFSELMLARMVCDRDLQCVCIRKYRATLTNSVQLLLRNKIGELGWDKYFEVQRSQIKRVGGRGFIAFTGMQDHNATSIKGFENFGVAWVDEANELDDYSFRLLRPTLRAASSELWFTWNPEQPDDPVDQFFRGDSPPDNAIAKGISFKNNPFLSETAKQEEQLDLAADPEKHAWVWLGEYNVKSDAVVFAGRWRVAEVDTGQWDGPYYGADWGFANDPTAAVEAWVSGHQIYISCESYAYRLEIDRTADRWRKDIPGIYRAAVRADNARPESISLVKRRGFSRITPCEKWSGCVEDGIEWLRSHEIIVHPRCTNMQTELKRYRYKQNRGGDVLAQLVDRDNHLLDALRYSLEKLIKNRGRQYGEARAYW
ncbi:MAG: PBSX family phage terminase large subunit [Cyanobacteria bacterium J06554_11]